MLLLFILLLIIEQSFKLFTDAWLANWTQELERFSLRYRLTVYLGSAFGYCVIIYFRTIVMNNRISCKPPGTCTISCSGRCSVHRLSSSIQPLRVGSLTCSRTTWTWLTSSCRSN